MRSVLMAGLLNNLGATNMRQLILSILLLLAVFPSSVSLAAPTDQQSQGSPVVDTSVDSNLSFNDYIKALGIKVFLLPEDARTYSSDLTGLVGSYFYIDDDDNIQLIGRPDAIPQATAFQLKDKIEYQAATDQGSSISATLPWLSFIFGHNSKTSILMQDIATVVGTSDPAKIHANIPQGIAPANKQIFFITGATVTLVSATQYFDTNVQGSSIIQVGGKYLYTKNILQNAWIISINKVAATQPPSGVTALMKVDLMKGRAFHIKTAKRKH